MTILRTSEHKAGQIYLPQINFMLLLGVLALVALFHTSDNLAHAYGLAVTGTMVVTTSLAFIVVRYLWKWRLWQACAFIAPFLILDVTFLAANCLKILSGGWVPLLIGGSLFGVMATWVHGVRILTEKARALLQMAPPGDLVVMTDPATGLPISGSSAGLTQNQSAPTIAAGID